MRAGIAAEDQDAVGHFDCLLDVVRDHQDALCRDAALDPQVEQVGAQGLGGQHVESGKGLVQQQDGRFDHKRAGKADALPHAA